MGIGSENRAEERIDYFQVGRVNPRGDGFVSGVDVASLSEVELDGLALAKFVLEASCFRCPVGDSRIESETCGNKEFSVSAVQITRGEKEETTSWQKGAVEEELVIPRKFSPKFERDGIKMMAAYFKKARQGIDEALHAFYEVDNKKSMLSVVGLGDYIKIWTKQGRIGACVHALKWKLDKGTGSIECHIKASSDGMIYSFKNEDFCRLITPQCMIQCCGGYESDAMKLVSMNNQGIARPFAVTDGNMALVVDNSVLRYVADGKTEVLGEWQGRRLVIPKAPGTRFGVALGLGEGHPAEELFKWLRPCLAYVSYMRHMIAPYGALETNVVDIRKEDATLEEEGDGTDGE